MKKPRRNQKSTHRSKKIASDLSGNKRKTPSPVGSPKGHFAKAVEIARWLDRGYRIYRFCQDKGFIPPGDEIWHAIKEAVSALT